MTPEQIQVMDEVEYQMQKFYTWLTRAIEEERKRQKLAELQTKDQTKENSERLHAHTEFCAATGRLGGYETVKSIFDLYATNLSLELKGV